MYSPAMSAHETFSARGYSDEEGKRIRGFLPRRFGDISNALPLTNIDFWLAYECMKHYNLNSRGRGRFYAQAPLNFQDSNSKVTYRSETLNEDFSMVEFIRHFGDVVFTDFDNNYGMKIARTNADGSLVIKNRMVTTRLAEIEKQAQPKDYNGFSWGGASGLFHFPVGTLHLPPTGSITPELLLDACFHGNLAKEFQIVNGARIYHPAMDFKGVATYLYLKRDFHGRDKVFGEDYFKEREDIMFQLRFRGEQTIYPSDVANPPKMFYVEGKGMLSSAGFTQYERFYYDSISYGYFNTMFRFANNGHVVAVPVMPVSLYNEHSQEEWMAILA